MQRVKENVYLTNISSMNIPLEFTNHSTNQQRFVTNSAIDPESLKLFQPCLSRDGETASKHDLHKLQRSTRTFKREEPPLFSIKHKAL